MKRLIYALAQIAVVVWAAFVVYQHDLHDPGQIAPFMAAIVLRGWLSKDIADPIFGHESMGTWLTDKLKRLTPKRQPKSGWNV